MPSFLWIPIVAAAISIVVIALALRFFLRPRRRMLRSFRLVQAKRRFHLQRERLEAKFIQLAAAHCGPNVPRWVDCDFADDVAYVRNRVTGELAAFVAVTITAEESDHASHHAATNTDGDLQAGTAVFRFDRDHWETEGRTFLNLSPVEAVRHCGDDFEMIGEELAHHHA